MGTAGSSVCQSNNCNVFIRNYKIKISRWTVSSVGEKLYTCIIYHVSKHTLLTPCLIIQKRNHSWIQPVSLSYWVTLRVECEVTYLSSYVTPHPVETLGQLEIPSYYFISHVGQPPSLNPLCNPQRAHTQLTPEYIPLKNRIQFYFGC